MSRVFCDVLAYVSCRKYDGTSQSARKNSAKQGGTADQIVFALGRKISAKGVFCCYMLKNYYQMLYIQEDKEADR